MQKVFYVTITMFVIVWLRFTMFVIDNTAVAAEDEAMKELVQFDLRHQVSSLVRPVQQVKLLPHKVLLHHALVKSIFSTHIVSISDLTSPTCINKKIKEVEATKINISTRGSSSGGKGFTVVSTATSFRFPATAKFNIRAAATQISSLGLEILWENCV
ncbi:hypothetical protein YC2023_079190 [Brassica napus]